MPSVDPFKSTSRTRSGGPANLAEVTPSDSEELEVVSQWLYIGQAGSLRATANGGQTVDFASIHQGWHLVELRQIHATGTSAADIVVGW